MFKRILTFTFFLFLSDFSSAMDLNETTIIINDANEATQILQDEFNTLVNEVIVQPIDEIDEFNSSNSEAIIDTLPIEEVILEVNESIMNEPKEFNTSIELNQSIESNITLPRTVKEFSEANKSIEVNTSIGIQESNHSKKHVCIDNNQTLLVKESNNTLDNNHSIPDNGCTDTEVHGTSVRGLIIYKTRIKPYCEMSGEKFAKQYVQEDWDDIYYEKEFKREVLKACPKIERRYKDKWTPHLYQFTLEYASDSDAIPEC